MEKNKDKIQAKNLFLTYSQTNSLMTRKYVLNVLKQKLIGINNGLDAYGVCLEKHKDGNPHCHAVLKLKYKPQIYDMRFFDISVEGKEEPFHPNIRTCVFEEKLLYIAKEDKEPLISAHLNVNQIRKKLLNKKKYDELLSYLIEIVKDEGLHSALNYFQENSSNLVIGRDGPKVRRALENADYLFNRRKTLSAKYPNSAFKRLKSLEEFLEAPFVQYVLWLSGASNLAKTSKVQAECVERNLPAFSLRSEDNLKARELLPGDVIIADDTALTHFCKKPEDFKQFFDTEFESVIKARYKNIDLAPDIKRIVLSNDTFDTFLKENNLQDNEAIINRVKASRINETLVNVYINHTVNVIGDNNTINIDQRPFADETLEDLTAKPRGFSHLDESIRGA